LIQVLSIMRSYSTIFTINILVGLIGLTAIGCTNVPTTAVPQPTPSKSSASIDAPRSTVPVVKGDDQPTETPVDAASVPVANVSTAAVTPNIQAGRYWVGGTDQALEVQSDRYRYDTEGGEQPWRSTTELKTVKEGVIFDGKAHWCLSTMAPESGAAACSETGWVKQIERPTQIDLPFIGTRQYTFPGGNGANASVTIEANGNTTIKDNSLRSSEDGLRIASVIYQGKFSRPIVFENYGLIFTSSKVSKVLPNGEADTTCSSKAACEVEFD
jgi:hypothetical protein